MACFIICCGRYLKSIHPWCALGAFPAAVATTESTTGTPTCAPTRHDPRPLPPGVRPAPGVLTVLSPPSPWASGEPRPHARFQERLSDLFHLLPPDETRGPPSIFPSIRVFSMSRFFASGGQSIGISASASVLPMNIQDLFPLGLITKSGLKI